MAGKFTVATEIVKETEKAVLVAADGVNVWLPKSQIEIWLDEEASGYYCIWMAGWLWAKKRFSFNYMGSNDVDTSNMRPILTGEAG